MWCNNDDFSRWLDITKFAEINDLSTCILILGLKNDNLTFSWFLITALSETDVTIQYIFIIVVWTNKNWNFYYEVLKYINVITFWRIQQLFRSKINFQFIKKMRMKENFDLVEPARHSEIILWKYNKDYFHWSKYVN